MCVYSEGIKLLYYSLEINESERFKVCVDVQYQILVPMEWRGLYQSTTEEAIDVEKEKKLPQNDSILFSSHYCSGASSKIYNLFHYFVLYVLHSNLKH